MSQIEISAWDAAHIVLAQWDCTCIAIRGACLKCRVSAALKAERERAEKAERLVRVQREYILCMNDVKRTASDPHYNSSEREQAIRNLDNAVAAMRDEGEVVSDV